MCVLLSERCNLALIACTSCHVSSSTFLPTFFQYVIFSHCVRQNVSTFSEHLEIRTRSNLRRGSEIVLRYQTLEKDLWQAKKATRSYFVEMKMKADFATKKGRAESNLLRPLILIGSEFNYKQACTQKLNQLYSITQSAIFACFC